MALLSPWCLAGSLAQSDPFASGTITTVPGGEGLGSQPAFHAEGLCFYLGIRGNTQTMLEPSHCGLAYALRFLSFITACATRGRCLGCVARVALALTGT